MSLCVCVCLRVCLSWSCSKLFLLVNFITLITLANMYYAHFVKNIQSARVWQSERPQTVAIAIAINDQFL